MSTLKTHNLQSSDSGSVNIAMTQNAGMVVTGISTFNNKVLIGTTTEGSTSADDLTISGSGEIGMTIRSTNSSQCNLFFSDGTSGAAEYAGVIRYDHATNSMRVWTNGDSEKLRIASNGNISIGGNSSVGTKVHVENSSGDAHIRLRSSHNCGVLYTRHSDAALIGYTGSGNAVNLGSSNLAVSASLSGGQIVFQTGGTASSNERMRINSSGLVGIGTDNPTSNLQVNHATNECTISLFNGGSKKAALQTQNSFGTILYSYDSEPLLFSVSSGVSYSKKLEIDSTGNMGLGLTPAYSGLFGGAQRTFHIGGTAAPCLRITSSTSGQADLVVHAGNSARRVDIANITANGAISIWTKPSSGSIAERIKISSAGYVTKPATPAFFATHSGASNSQTGYLTFNTSGSGYYNNGGHFDVGTGAFHAPVDGIYHFHFHGFFQVNQNNASFEVNFYRANSNGSGVASMCRQYGYRQGVTNQYGPSISMHYTGPMSAGQTMRVHTATLAFHGSNGYYFGGYLIG